MPELLLLPSKSETRCREFYHNCYESGVLVLYLSPRRDLFAMFCATLPFHRFQAFSKCVQLERYLIYQELGNFVTLIF